MKIARSCTLLTLTTLLATSAPALAQDALGAGDALDANLSTQGPRNTVQRSHAASLRYRNLLVTGNVAGGRGFRGTIGYTAAADFRGELGSNDLFEFRAGSALSNPAFVVNQGRFRQFELGYALGNFEYQRSGSGAGASLLNGIPSTIRGAGFSTTTLNLDRLTASMVGNARVDDIGGRQFVGGGVGDDGPYYITGSGLRGLTEQSLSDRLMLDGLPTIDQIHAKVEQNAGRGYRPDSEFRPELETVMAKPLAERLTDQRLASEINLQYDSILTTLADTYRNVTDDEENADPTGLPGAYDALRRNLMAGPLNPTQLDRTDPDGPGDGLGDGDDPADRTSLRDDLQRSFADRVAMLLPEEDDTLDDVAVLLRHDREINDLAADVDDRFNQLIRLGQKELEKGGYFNADEHFERALQFVPGHPMAMSGKANAMIGAGLYPAASAALESLFANSPEMIDVKFADRLLPTRERMDICVQRLRERMRLERPQEEVRSIGLLMAYIGHQTGDSELVDEGLAIMTTSSESDDLLPPLLRRVWGSTE